MANAFKTVASAEANSKLMMLEAERVVYGTTARRLNLNQHELNQYIKLGLIAAKDQAQLVFGAGEVQVRVGMSGLS